MTAELLRRAATLMRERAEVLVEIRDTCAEAGVSHYERQIKRHGGGPLFKAHFSSWHPAVALAVADWLDETADHLDIETNQYADGSVCLAVDAAASDCSIFQSALAVARAYLGEAADA